MYELVAVRTEPSDDLSHRHIELVGYYSPHLQNEAVMVDVPRIVQKIALGEKFCVTVGDDKAEVQPAACPVCGYQPQLKTTADTKDDSKILDLPEK